MPRIVERRLAREADRKGLTGDRRKAYIYGTMSRIEQGKKKKHEKR